MRKTKILLVDDDKNFCDLVSYNLGLNPSYDLKVVHCGKDFEQEIKSSPEVALIDYYLPDRTGDQLLQYTQDHSPNTDVIMVSGQDEIGLAIDLLRKGAYDYISKDQSAFKKLWSVLAKLKERAELLGEVKQLKKELSKVTIDNSPIIGESDQIQQTMRLVEKAAGSNINVLIQGETGTGKELVAQTIHANSSRSKKAFVAINVAAIPAELLESELFGHRKGAFTGATNDREGKFEEANGGTVFLDEIGEMDPVLQAKILRVLQEREVIRVGDNKPVPINIRLIVATNKDLKNQVDKEEFREDLYYRLLGLTIQLPPLRDRGLDVLVLSDYFIASFSEENGVQPKKLHKSAQKKLFSYDFPGNVRELKSLIDLAMVLSEQPEIVARDIKIDKSGKRFSPLGKEMTMKEYEWLIISHYLDKYDSDINKVAQVLQIGASSIYRKISQRKQKK